MCDEQLSHLGNCFLDGSLYVFTGWSSTVLVNATAGATGDAAAHAGAPQWHPREAEAMEATWLGKAVLSMHPIFVPHPLWMLCASSILVLVSPDLPG